MSDSTHNFLFAHRGMLQSKRLEQAPDPDAMKVSGRTFEELVGRAAELARNVLFFEDDNTVRPDGKDGDQGWQDFFKDVYDYDRKRVRTECIEEMVRSASVPPHLALLFAFFRMSLITQDSMNTLTGRQMDFYFRNILGFRMRKGTEGNVTVFAELGRNVNAVSIAKGLLFDAGKDAEGKPVTYEAMDELLLGNEEVAALVHYSPLDGYRMQPIPVLETAARGTVDGKSSAGAGTDGSAENKTHALCIAAKVLDIPHCEMTVSFPGCDSIDFSTLKDLRAEYTSAEGWASFSDSSLTIGKDMPSISGYDPIIHGPGLDTSFPVIRFVSEDGLEALSPFDNVHLNKIKVEIKDYIPSHLTNKYGEIENKSGINPFGPDCKKGDWVEIILPFTDPKAEIQFGFNDGFTYTTGFPDDAEGPRYRCTLNDDNCDQAAISKAFAASILKAFTKGNDSKETSAVTELQMVAVYPKLLGPATVKSATGEDSVSVFLQHPCGTDQVTGKSTVTKDTDLMGQIALLDPISGVDESDCAVENGSALFICLAQTGRSPGQISLYLDNTGKAKGPGLVRWSYRNGSLWVDFAQSAILKDTTCGLSQSGIVTFDFKEPLPLGDERFLGGLPCLRCICDNDNGRYIKEARTRAIELAYSNSSVGAGPGGAPLPKNTINKAVHSVVGVKAFSQPYDGVPGKRAEDDVQFRRRVAERLRHKGRVWSTWDYETLVLEQFPDITYVKCLPTCQPDGTAIPGHVTIVIIPQSADDPLRPAPRIRMVNDVTTLLESVSSGFSQIHVIGPTCKEVAVTAKVALRPGYNDTTKYDALITDALTDYLRSWVGYGNGQRFKDGDSVSDIIAFLESLPYVDIIEDLTVTVDGEAVTKDGKIERKTAVEVLTSAPVHDIKCHTAD